MKRTWVVMRKEWREAFRGERRFGSARSLSH
jgi:hypothetical protein